MRQTKKILSILLAVIMVVGMVPLSAITAFADFDEYGNCQICTDWHTICSDCYTCYNCAITEGIHCADCEECMLNVEMCEDSISYGLNMCADCCVDRGFHCELCYGHTADSLWCPIGGEESHCLYCVDEEGGFYCSECGELICTICNEVEYCEDCETCADCLEQMYGAAFCEDCGACLNCVGEGNFCPNCSLCSDCTDLCTDCYEYCSNCSDMCYDCYKCADCVDYLCEECYEICAYCTYLCVGCNRCDYCTTLCEDCHELCEDCTDMCEQCYRCSYCTNMCDDCRTVCEECASDFCQSCNRCIDCIGGPICSDCGECEDCGNEICPGCQEYCRNCVDFCPDCGECEYCCDGPTCPDCHRSGFNVIICKGCERFCNQCRILCPSCGKCSNCSSLCEVCKKCYDCATDKCWDCGEYCLECIEHCEACGRCLIDCDKGGHCIVYKMLSGDGQIVTKGNTATFVSEADYSKFLDCVIVDGILLRDNSSYTVTSPPSGSTSVTLSRAFLDTLSVGVHTIRIISTDGAAVGTFTIPPTVISKIKIKIDNYQVGYTPSDVTYQVIEGNEFIRNHDVPADYILLHDEKGTPGVFDNGELHSISFFFEPAPGYEIVTSGTGRTSVNFVINGAEYGGAFISAKSTGDGAYRYRYWCSNVPAELRDVTSLDFNMPNELIPAALFEDQPKPSLSVNKGTVSNNKVGIGGDTTLWCGYYTNDPISMGNGKPIVSNTTYVYEVEAVIKDADIYTFSWPPQSLSVTVNGKTLTAVTDFEALNEDTFYYFYDTYRHEYRIRIIKRYDVGPSSLDPTNLRWNGTVAKWDGVASPLITGYHVRVYKDGIYNGNYVGWKGNLPSAARQVDLSDILSKKGSGRYTFEVVAEYGKNGWEMALSQLSPVLNYPSGTISGVTVSGSFKSYKDTSDTTIQLILSGTSEPAYEAVVQGSLSGGVCTGNYSIPAVAPGTYTMRVFKKNHVTREYTITVSGSGTVMQDVKIHLLGDVNGDGRVNTSDVGRANLHAKGTSLLTDYAYKCGNVNGDSRINTSDVGRINLHARGTNPLWS